MIKLEDKTKCSGCTSCYNKCPVKAIKMVVDTEGFKYPVVDYDKCIKCGLCLKSCPYKEKYINKESFKKPIAYGGFSNNDKYRDKATSGGIFSHLAKYVIEQGGFVCGAVFNEKLNVQHIIIDNIKDIEKINGSKYVQSDLGNMFNEIKLLLDDNKLVLFSGTPCQVTGILKFLGKEYSNLITVDLICHGVPSPLVFDKYKKFLEEKNKSKPNKIYFRTKLTGWKSYSTYVKFDSGKELIQKSGENPYMRGFLKDIFLRPSCSNCISSKLPRDSDITLGDFWGVQNNYKELDDDKGTSLILVNTTKGKTLIEDIKDDVNIKKCDLNVSISGNPSLINSVKTNAKREQFFIEINNTNFEKASKKYFPKMNVISKVKNKIIKIIEK